MRLLIRRAAVHGHPGATALAVEDGRIAWIGAEDGAEAWSSASVVDARGGWLAPSFTDSHVHLVQAGFRLTELDLHGSPSLSDTLDRLRARAAEPGEGVLLGQGWDESLWSARRPPSGAELEQAAPGRLVCLTRVDGHSSVISPALARSVPDLAAHDGWSADGRVERDAHHEVRRVLADLIGPDQRLAAARVACGALVASGITAFHENAAPHIGPEYELDLVRRAAEESGVHGTYYWGEIGALDTARRLGVRGLAGDLNADGALGSRTAALHTPYADQPDHCGHAYLEPEQIAEHVVLCTREGLQAGFHCIGEAALTSIGAGFRIAAERIGSQAVRAGRHRLEHVEMPTAETVATLAALGVTASVQPLFDAHWGGPDQMYAQRLGERWRGMNPFRSLLEAGVPLAFGSDSPVTAIGAWEAVSAAVHHHRDDQSLTPADAFRAHTEGGWRAAGIDDAGSLRVGARAHLALWPRRAGLDSRGGIPLPHEGEPVPSPDLVVAGDRVLSQSV